MKVLDVDEDDEEDGVAATPHWAHARAGWRGEAESK